MYAVTERLKTILMRVKREMQKALEKLREDDKVLAPVGSVLE